MNYPTEFQVMQQEREAEEQRPKKQRCLASERGGCFCTGRCQYTEKEWEEIQDLKEKLRFTGVNEMKFPIGD